MNKSKYDFTGWATKNDIKCSDGRTIKKDAFKHQDNMIVPLVWQHLSDDPTNILGHALLENKPEGVLAHCIFNNSVSGQHAKELVRHKDIDSLSIFANRLKQNGKDVMHGMIREVSLVLSGANPGAKIESVTILHTDGSENVDDTEVIIHTGETFVDVTDAEEKSIEHGDKTIAAVIDTMTEEQKDAMYALLALAVEDGNGATHSDEGGTDPMKKNVFEGGEDHVKNSLTHAEFKTILDEAARPGETLKSAILKHATTFGIENIDVLFPDAQALQRDPAWLQRETGWVDAVLNAVGKSPFSRVKSVMIDMDFDSARAKGYVKGTMKKEVYIKAAKRVTTPYTVYVKQKLDRDDVIDVVDFDTVAIVRKQLRILLNEELATSFLLGDGRAADHPDKINEENIRPIWTDEDLYTVKTKVETNPASADLTRLVEEIAFAHEDYKGSGNPVLYTTPGIHTKMLWIKDSIGRRIYETDAMLCAALRVSRIEEVQHMEGKTRDVGGGKTRDLVAIKVNLSDYNVGADKGGSIATFDDFDIDFNQLKYLMETRCSGALVKPMSAQVFEFERSVAQG